MSYLKEDTLGVLMDAALFAKEGDNPSKAIYEQEKRGAEKVKRYSMLPSKTNDGIPQTVLNTGIPSELNDYSRRAALQLENNRKWTRKQYENMGIKCESVEDDAMFIKATLPEGWAINNTDHSMWNNVTDDKGRIRFTFFYKAAFYDRDAFTNFNRRFNIESEYVIPEGVVDIYKELSYEERKTLHKFACVKDSDGTILFKTKSITQTGDYSTDYYAMEPLLTMCKNWLNDNYPNYEDFSAYWD